MDIFEKLYNQNCKKYRIKDIIRFKCKGFSCIVCRTFPQSSGVLMSSLNYGKYTIVEIAVDGKHYHGLAAKAECDAPKAKEGLAIAFNRAFKAMLDVD